MVAVKTSERRATLAGANMPQNHVLQVVSQPAKRNCVRGTVPVRSPPTRRRSIGSSSMIAN
jgi:hypothetical protein